VRNILKSGYRRVVWNARHIILRERFSDIWRRLVLALEHRLPHHSWHPYVSTGMIVERVS
jgi:hypothetical protein